MHTGLNKKGRDSVYREMRGKFCEEDHRKNNSIEQETTTLSDTHAFMKSIIEELKVARENMLSWMREEIIKVMADDDDVQERNAIAGNHQQDMIKVQSQNSSESGSEAQACKWETLVGSVKRKWTIGSREGYDVLENQYFHKPVESVKALETKRKKFVPSVKQTSLLVSPDQDASKNFILPTSLPAAYDENQNFNSSSNYFQPIVAGNKVGVNTGNKRWTPHDSSIHSRSSLGFQPENSGHTAQIASDQDIDHIGQNKLNPVSRFGARFPIPLHHGFDGVLKTQAQLIRSPSHVQGSISDISSDGDLKKSWLYMK
uniref:Uncharacterized protein n=1 Tax=Nelumbo nucifera TaxID=4432 RepID=A0A822ZQ30_NELNU|nr:TPA_asm: hypothetical protein HUJ06_017279 [Nelumbo nucifera]